MRNVLNAIRNLATTTSKSKIRPSRAMERIEPRTCSIADNADFKGLFTPELNKLAEMFKRNNFELRIAGGSVRDLLMGIKPADVDFASTATPTEMKEMFTKEEIRMLHKRGEEHGTITCRIDDAENFEVTTLRFDVVCDGRRAEVEYTTDWQLDANRRDLTINSLFLSLDGTIYDYFGGIEDIEHRRVAFVGDARQRIQEDYLRILRYFRFFGRISNTPEHDPDTVRAIIENKDGLIGISAERIWTEMKKLVIGRMAPEVLKVMLDDCKLSKYLGIPEKYNLDRMKLIYQGHKGFLEPMTMIAALSETREEIDEFRKKVKISNDEHNLGKFIVNNRSAAVEHVDDFKWWSELLVEREARPDNTKEKQRSKIVQLARSVNVTAEVLKKISEFETPKFPIGGLDLMEAGVPKGPKVRNIINYLFDIWVKGNCEVEKEELIKRAFDEDIPVAKNYVKFDD